VVISCLTFSAIFTAVYLLSKSGRSFISSSISHFRTFDTSRLHADCISSAHNVRIVATSADSKRRRETFGRLAVDVVWLLTVGNWATVAADSTGCTSLAENV
jgi:hypothetical protein